MPVYECFARELNIGTDEQLSCGDTFHKLLFKETVEADYARDAVELFAKMLAEKMTSSYDFIKSFDGDELPATDMFVLEPLTPIDVEQFVRELRTVAVPYAAVETGRYGGDDWNEESISSAALLGRRHSFVVHLALVAT